jgi:hypothetical protein
MSSPQNNILKGSIAQTQNKNQKNPTHEKPVPATVLPNKLDTETIPLRKFMLKLLR